MQDVKHTPLPYTITHAEGRSYLVANTKIADIYSTAFGDKAQQIANAEFIVRACNSYYLRGNVLSDIKNWLLNPKNRTLTKKQLTKLIDYAIAEGKVEGEAGV